MRFANAIYGANCSFGYIQARLFIGYFKARLETNSRGHYALGNSKHVLQKGEHPKHGLGC